MFGRFLDFGVEKESIGIGMLSLCRCLREKDGCRDIVDVCMYMYCIEILYMHVSILRGRKMWR